MINKIEKGITAQLEDQTARNGNATGNSVTLPPAQ